MMPLRIILFFAFTILLIGDSCSQVIGGNGEGFTIVINDADIPYLNEISIEHPIAIRWPGGGDAKLAFPSLDKPGLGINKDSVQKLYEKFRDQEGNIKQESLEKDLREADQDAKRNESALQTMINISRQVKGLQVDYSLNVLQGNAESNVSAIKTLIDSGVNIVSIVAGNETFYAYNYDFESYLHDFEPVLKECQRQFPTIPRFLCLGQEIHRKDHIGWNNKVINYIRSTGDFISGVDVHYYLMEELKEPIKMHPQFVTYKPDSLYVTLNNAFEKYISITNADPGMQELIDYLHLNLPGKKYHCTEFGDKHAEYWSNTIANGGHIFMTFCKYRNDFDMLLVHNLIANWYWAARRPTGKLDDNPEQLGKINRVQWYSIQLANEMPYESLPLLQSITLSEPGEYYFYFNNAGAKSWTPEINTGKYKIVNIELHYVTGKYPYSSAGQTGFMDKNSIPSLEVKGINIISMNSIMPIPYNSFGYLKIKIE